MKKQRRLIGEILVNNGIVNKEQLDMAIEIQKKEGGRFSSIKIIVILVFFILFILFIYNLNRHKDIIIQEAKIVTGVDKDMSPLKVTNFFPKDTSKVSAWISWKNAKINTQILVKWYYVTDDVPIYDYSLNIPKRDGVANVVLAMPEGKNLPSGLYKVYIFLGKKRPTKTLSFEIE
jgi:hypothetical protein